MNYKLLNKQHVDYIGNIIESDKKYEFDDPSFLGMLSGELPCEKYGNGRFNSEVIDLERELRNHITAYDACLTNKEEFLTRLKELTNAINEVDQKWNTFNYYEIRNYVSYHCNLIIEGEGGRGKTFFIKELEKNLVKKEIPHLCLYGKFLKNIDEIDICELEKAAKEKGFVFIVDAINELNNETFHRLYSLLNTLKANSNMRIILTCRSNSLSESKKSLLDSLTFKTILFPGVSIESCYEELIKSNIINLDIYFDIINSNNAFYIKMLSKYLQNHKVIDGELNAIATFTFLLENYIKESIGCLIPNGKSFKKEIWEETKKLVEYLYKKNMSYFTKEVLIEQSIDVERYINSMVQIGILVQVNDAFYFTDETMVNYLEARYLMKELGNINGEYEKAKLIRSIVRKNPKLKEAIVISLLDLYVEKDTEKLVQLLEQSGLINYFISSSSVVIKAHFTEAQITKIQSMFSPCDLPKVFFELGGIANKPYNCKNYYNEVFIKDPQLLRETIKRSPTEVEISGTALRLKNNLYVIVRNKAPKLFIEETFYFALWSTAIPNRNVRTLAEKTLYETVVINQKYVELLIEYYEKVDDLFVRESIVFVLSNVCGENQNICEFFRLLLESDATLFATSIARIEKYLGDEYGYVELDRPCVSLDEAHISDEMRTMVHSIEIRDKYFFPFNINGMGNYFMDSPFIMNEKAQIKNFNEKINKAYSCIKTGDCNGSIDFYNLLPDKYKFKKKHIDVETQILPALEKILVEEFEKYNIDFNFSMSDFENSILFKCVKSAVQLLLSNLMCNYYVDEFLTASGEQNSVIGFKVYDPLEYRDDYIKINTPVCVFYEKMEKVADKICKYISVPDEKNVDWQLDVELAKKNIENLSRPIKYDSKQWIILACIIRKFERCESGEIWHDVYDYYCCSDCTTHLSLSEDTRKLAIDLPSYCGNLSSYISETTNSNSCHYVESIDWQNIIFDNATLALPPSDIISFFKLKLKRECMEWVSNGETIIKCYNNPSSYLVSPVSRLVLMRKEHYDEYEKRHGIKFFAFNERYLTGSKKLADSYRYFELENGKTVNRLVNPKWEDSFVKFNNSECESCTKVVNCDYNESRLKSYLDFLKI